MPPKIELIVKPPPAAGYSCIDQVLKEESTVPGKKSFHSLADQNFLFLVRLLRVI